MMKPPDKHVIVLVHGIRTFGDWQDRLAALIKARSSQIEVHVYKYGYFGAIAFLIPVFRYLVMRRFRRYLASWADQWQDSRVDIVAHSFGTHIVAHALRTLPPESRPPIHTIVLAGSVLKQLFPWERLLGSRRWIKRIVNECGRGDIWPVIAQLFVLGMGAAGRQGFAGVVGPDVGIVNRYHMVGHSGFFGNDFMERKWLPLLLTEDPQLFEESISPNRGFAAALEAWADPIKIFCLTVFLLAPAGLAYYRWTQKNLEIAEARAVSIEERAKRESAEKDKEILKATAESERQKSQIAEQDKDLATAAARQERQNRLIAEQRGLIAEAERQREYQGKIEAQRRERIENSLRLVSNAFEALYRAPDLALLRAWEAHRAAPGPVTENALRSAYKVAMLHHYNRREASLFTGSGPSYLATRWKQGNLFSKDSADGRRRLLVTERGADGASPPGDVYILENETQQSLRLDACQHAGRAEDASFDQTERYVFVSRNFKVGVYSLARSCLASYDLGCCTKSPVHLTGGLLLDRYIIAAESKGGLWLLDFPDGGANRQQFRSSAPTITLHDEWYRGESGEYEAVIAIALRPARDQALIMYETGRADLLSLDSARKPRMARMPISNLLAASFAPDLPDTLYTAGRDGRIRVWRTGAGAVEEVAQFDKQNTALDWIIFSEDTSKILAVGSDRKAYVFERSRRERIGVIDYRQDVDWASARQALFPPIPLGVGAPVEAQHRVSYPHPALAPMRRAHAAGMDWIFAADGVYRLNGAEAERVLERYYAGTEIEAVGPVLWFRPRGSAGSVSGAALLVSENRLYRLPSEKHSVQGVLADGQGVLLATNAGAFWMEGMNLTRITSEEMVVRQLIRAGQDIWMGTNRGAYRWVNRRLIRVTEPFLDVREIKEVGTDIWILTKRTGGFLSIESRGPAYRVDGFFSSPVIEQTTSRVNDVVHAEGRTWILAADGLYMLRNRETSATRIQGLNEDVASLRLRNGAIVASTISDRLFSSAGPDYVVDPEKGTARRVIP